MVVIVTYFHLPESKGRSPAELDEMFEARIPARKFKSMSRCAYPRLQNNSYLGYVCATATANFVPKLVKEQANSKELEYAT